MHNMDGFFIAKLIKLKDGKKEDKIETGETEKKSHKVISKKGLGKRDRMKLKNKGKNFAKKPEENGDEGEEDKNTEAVNDQEEMLKKRKSELKEKLALLKKKKQH